MWKDPIVEEVRAIRRELSQEAGDDLHEICRRLREWEAKNPDRLVTTTVTPKKVKRAPRRKPVSAEKK